MLQYATVFCLLWNYDKWFTNKIKICWSYYNSFFSNEVLKMYNPQTPKTDDKPLYAFSHSGQ